MLDFFGSEKESLESLEIPIWEIFVCIENIFCLSLHHMDDTC